jgi:protein-S-isoprenylcysteine O-methyltransferase Ste14
MPAATLVSRALALPRQIAFAPSREASTRDVYSDLFARVVVGALFTMLSVNILADFLRTGRITGLLLLTGESLVVIMTIARRRAVAVDRSVAATVLTVLSLAGPPLLRANDASPMVSDAMTAMLSAMGLIVVVIGKIALGRSFGLVPANRGVVVRGPYGLVRHPIYTGYLVTHVAFLMAHPSPLNAALLLVADTALILRALMEERVLQTDAVYEQYCRRVQWHLVPGIF